MKNFKYLLSFITIIFLISCGGGGSSDGNGKEENDNPITSNSKALISFSIITPEIFGIINETTKTVSIIVPIGTNKVNLITAFETTGVKTTINGIEQISEETSNNFTNSVIYTIHAEDNSTIDYIVTVTTASSSDKSILSFSLNGINAIINETLKTIDLIVPNGTNVNSMIAIFSISGTTVKIGSIIQISGETSNNFTNSIIYKVIAADLSEQEYLITVTIAESIITHIITKNIPLIPIDSNFFYLIEATKELWYYRTKVLSKYTCSYTETVSTYSDGIFVSSITSDPITYTFTDFFSIGLGINKVLYFTIDNKNYKQQNGIITEIGILPIRPIKSKVTGSTVNFTITYNSYTDTSQVQGFNSSNTFQSKIITDFVESYCPVGTGYEAAPALFTNVSITSCGFPTGLYYLRRSSTAGISGILIKVGKGEMW